MILCSAPRGRCCQISQCNAVLSKSLSIVLIVLIIQVNITISTIKISVFTTISTFHLNVFSINVFTIYINSRTQHTFHLNMSPPQCVHHHYHFTCSAHRASTAWSTSLLSFSCLTFGTSKIHLRFKFCFCSFATLEVYF